MGIRFRMDGSAPERLRDVDRVFDAALDLPTGKRAAFLKRACGSDDGLRTHVERLLHAHGEARDFLEIPASEIVAADLLPTPATPEHVGPFRVVREIGRGGMGTVYLAERDDGQFEQRVALKLIRQVDSPDVVLRFLEERRILALLEHPRIARLVDGGVAADGDPWFAMEYIDGEPIDRYCDAHTLSIVERLRLVVDICDAVQYAHQHFIVHRDIKPSNVLVMPDGRLKLLDFGVAKLVDPVGRGDDITTAGSLRTAMTPEYAAPEQVRGEPVSAATDVYALGVLLYVLLTGQRPYEVRGFSPARIERIVCELEPSRPSAVIAADHEANAQSRERARKRGTTPERMRRALAGDLDSIVLKALAKDAKARYHSADALARDLRRHLAREPVLAHRQTPTYRALRFVKRHRLETLAVLTVSLSLIVAITQSLVQARQVRGERDRAEAASREAAAVTAFVLQLFEAVDPADVRGDTLTAADIVRRATARIDRLRGHPADQARLLEVTAKLDRNLGRDAAADSLLQRALTLRTGLSNEAPLELARTLEQRSEVLVSLSRYAAADSAARWALALEERALGSRHPVVAGTLQNLASIAVFRGDLPESVRDHRRALAIREQSLGPMDSLTAHSHLLLGAVLRRQGQLDEAEQEYRNALAISEHALGKWSPEVASTMLMLAYLLDEDESRYDEAEGLYRRALAIRARVFGENDPVTAYALGDLGDCLLRRGDTAQAIALNARYVQIIRRAFGEDHPVTATATAQMAMVLYKAGKLDAAEPLFRRAITMDRRLRGNDHEAVLGVETGLARLLIDRREFDGARSVLADASRISERLYAHDEVGRLRVSRLFGLLMLRQGDYVGADSVFRASIAAIERHMSRRQPDVRELYRWLGDVEQAQGRRTEAARDYAIASAR